MGSDSQPQNRNARFNLIISPLIILSICFVGIVSRVDAADGVGGPYQATGFKTGEATDSSIIVWTRLTARRSPNPSDGPMFRIVRARDSEGQGRGGNAVTGLVYPNGAGPADIRDAVPGTPGEVRIRYRPRGSDDAWQQTAWQPVDANADFTRQLHLENLQANTFYHIIVESRKGQGGRAGQSLEGSFRTAPNPNEPARVFFTVSTGQAFPDQDAPDGFAIYPRMLKYGAMFFVHTGDIVYYDKLAKTPALAHYHWQRTYGLPTNVAFHRFVSSYFIKDDHDTLIDDCWPSMGQNQMYRLTFDKGLEIFRQQVPMGDKTYRTVRWGKDLQIWMVEGRDFRRPNPMPDGPEKTIWGEQQKAWFKRTVEQSNATYRILISPTPIVGPDRTNKRDNHSNAAFAYEGNELRNFISKQENMVVVCGDRHWQYMSVDPKTSVHEYSSGPASNQHAGGWRQEDFRPEYHKFLRVSGGFLSVEVDRVDDQPQMTMRFHAVGGAVHFEDRL